MSPDSRAGTEARRIAVVVPCFDAEHVAETVASIEEHAGEPVELVLVDDGTTAPTALRALAELEQRGVRVLRQENRGQGAAAMTGVAATVARYVTCFDADDVLVPPGLSAFADALDADPQAAVAYGDMITFGLTGYAAPSMPVFDPWLLTYANRVPSASLVRRSALLAAGGWPAHGGFVDWNLWLSFVEHGFRGVHLEQTMYRYRRNADGLHASRLARFEEHYEDLRARHPSLFEARRELRRRSPAPRSLKLAIELVERLPVGRHTKLSLAQLLIVLLWLRKARVAAQMLAQGALLRLRPAHARPREAARSERA